MATLRAGDENDLADIQFLKLSGSVDNKISIADGLAANRVVERAPEGILAIHTQSDGGFFICKCVRRPVDEFGEIVDKGSLDLILGKWTVLSPHGTRAS